MVDLKSQYDRLKKEIDEAIAGVIGSTSFINGAQVGDFCHHLATYVNAPYVIPCGNGTDAIRLALQALDIQPGDEVILPAFTYIAAAEMIASLGVTPILTDVYPDSFNINTERLEQAISRRTKAIVVVHLFGQSCDMEPIMKVAEKYKIKVIEDNAQSLGADYTFADGTTKKAGTIGHIGTTSFFPTKPLACYGDGGAVITSDEKLAARIRMLANHGQKEKYHHQIIGCNSRLDSLQAAILDVKLRYMDDFVKARRKAAQYYDKELHSLAGIRIPSRSPFSTHVYHQYTVQVGHGRRDALQAFLKEKGVPSMIYYPMAVHEQEGYKWIARTAGDVSESIRLSREVLSIPMHTELTEEVQDYIVTQIKTFFSTLD